MKRILFVLSVMNVSTSLLGFIYAADVLKPQAAERQLPTVIGLSDFHDKAHPATQEQLGVIESCLRSCNPATTRIVLEDLSSAGSAGRFSCDRYMINSRGGILGGLAESFRAKNLTVENLEYRYCRVCSLGPVLNSVYYPIEHGSVHAITIAALVKEIEDIIQEVQKYQDGQRLNAYYAHIITEVKASLKKLRMRYTGHYSVAHYLSRYTSSLNGSDLVRQLLTFDSELLDCKLIHSIVNAREKNVIAIAGGSHIARVIPVLCTIGYQQTSQEPLGVAHAEYRTHGVSSAITQDCASKKPQALEVSTLRKVLLHEVE